MHSANPGTRTAGPANLQLNGSILYSNFYGRSSRPWILRGGVPQRPWARTRHALCRAVRPRTQQSTPPPDEVVDFIGDDGIVPEDLLRSSEVLQDLENDDEYDDYGAEVQWVADEELEEEGEGGEASTSGRVAGKRLPAEVRCFDTARILVKGGDGGKGCVAFRREKYVPKGGPSGGNGGRGGNVYLEGDASLNSLMSFRKQVHFRAAEGQPGGGSDMHGGAGRDVVVKVPPGTIVRRKGADAEEQPLVEVLMPGKKVLLAAGGRGGRGNLAFKTARNNAPALAELGERGEEMWVDLELKLVADVGIIGVPNAGKSTLLSVLSAAKPKVANYPFTTLVPNLGVCNMDYRTTVFADVPGLLEGAHSGIGLGHQFLRHVQRCRVLVHLIDGTSPDPMGDYRAIRQELELFNPELSLKPQVVAYNKMDVPDSSDYWEDIREQLLAEGVPPGDVYALSAVSGRGVPEVVRRVREVLDALPTTPAPSADLSIEPSNPETTWGPVAAAAAAATEGDGGLEGEGEGATPAVVAAGRQQRREARIGEFTLESDLSGPRVWFVKGEAIERFAQMTDWSYYEAARRFQRVLDAAGINSALKAGGVQEGDTVVIGELEFEYSADQSEQAMYERWYAERRAAGIVGKGQARWPHMTG